MAAANSRAENCRAKAQGCRVRAREVLDEASRQQLLALADGWESMARDIENIERLWKEMAEERMQLAHQWKVGYR